MEAPLRPSTFETSVRKLTVYMKAVPVVAAGEIVEISSWVSLFLVYY